LAFDKIITTRVVKMKKLLLASLLCLAAAGAHADVNVALNGAVTVAGLGIGDSGSWCCGVLADPSTVTDGITLPVGQQWNVNTVFWTADPGATSVTISLLHTASVSSLQLEADNNDDYHIEYLDTAHSWHDLTTISPHRSSGLDLGSATLSTPVIADGFRITAAAGDGHYAVAEFAAIGSPVPEPSSYAMLAAGLGLLAWTARRRTPP
jgi:hypothetical protein